jgi:hypothetical protein
MSFGAEPISVTTDTARGSRTIPFSQRCKSFLGATHEARYRVSSLPFVYSLLLEDFSSVVFDITRNLVVCKHPQRFCSVEIMYLLWKCQNGTIRAYGGEPLAELCCTTGASVCCQLWTPLLFIQVRNAVERDRRLLALLQHVRVTVQPACDAIAFRAAAGQRGTYLPGVEGPYLLPEPDMVSSGGV